MSVMFAIGIAILWLLTGMIALFIINRIDDDPDINVGEDLICVVSGPISLFLTIFLVIEVLNKRAKNKDIGNFYRVITGRKRIRNGSRYL